MSDRHLPDGYTLTPELSVCRLLETQGLTINYLCRDRTLEEDVLLVEYFPASLASRNADGSVSVAPAPHLRQSPVREGAAPILPLDDHIIVRGVPGGDTSITGVFGWGLNRFLSEARLLARLTHPNIARIFRVFEHAGTGYMTMQWTAGATLEEKRRHRGFSQDEVDLFAEPLFAALQRLHDGGLVHRDVRPGNVIIRGADGTPVLTGFGSATELKRLERIETTMFMAPRFTSPELIDATEAYPSLDIYGLAVTL